MVHLLGQPVVSFGPEGDDDPASGLDLLDVGQDLLVHLIPRGQDHDRHLLVNVNGTLSLTQSELVHFVRPSADLLFESLAASCRERAIAVVLSGSGIDGSLGITAVKKMGGTVIVQDEKTSEFFGMPGAAIDTGAVDPRVTLLLGIAPPLEGRGYDFSRVRASTKPKFFIQGERDEICPLAAMYRFYSQLPEPKELVVIDGADHLFDGKTGEVGDAIEDLLADFSS